MTDEKLQKANSWIEMIIKHGFTNVFAIAAMCVLLYQNVQSSGVVQDNSTAIEAMKVVTEQTTKAIDGLNAVTQQSNKAIDELKVEIRQLRRDPISTQN